MFLLGVGFSTSIIQSQINYQMKRTGIAPVQFVLVQY